jgi:mannosyltransferase OCH1-like enzyme
MPAELVAYGGTFREHHPGWAFLLWNETNLPPLRNRALFDRASSHAQRADIARYEILHQYGGIYIDTDFECLKPLDAALLDGVSCFCAAEGENYFAIGILGAVPRHPFLDTVIRILPAAVAASPQGGAVNQTGPGMFSRVLLERRRRGVDDVVVFPTKLFYPYHWSEPHKRDGPFPEAYAVHHWAGSWNRTRSGAPPGGR